MKILFARMLRAIKLDRNFFGEVAADPTLQAHSVWTVAIFAMATSFGFFGAVGGVAVNIALITTMLSWYIWAFSIFYIGSRLLGEKGESADRKTVIRVVAFAAAPGLIRVLAIIPKTAIVLMVVSSVWILAAAVVGLKQVFTRTATAKITIMAVGTWLAASLFQAIMIVTLLSVFGVSRSGP